MFKRLREFLTLGIIIGPLPSTINNGNAIDATVLMADLNWIVSQVNANAAPGGSSGEWTSPGVSPTFISATQFSVPGDLRTIFDMKRRLLLTVTAVNGGATITAAPTFGAGITTVTVATDTAGFLTAGLTAVSYGMLDAAILSTPKKSNFAYQTVSGVNVASNTTYTLGGAGGTPFASAGVYRDIFNEVTGANGVITFATTGTYLISVNAGLLYGGATITGLGNLLFTFTGTGFMNGSTAISFAPVTPANVNVAASLTNMAFVTAGDTLTVKVQTPTFTGGPMQSNSGGVQVVQLF